MTESLAYVDLTRREVVELIDAVLLPVPEEEANHDDASYVGRSAQPKLIEIMQPEGASFDVTGDVVTWENWTFRVGFEPREGLVLHQVSIQDGDGLAPCSIVLQLLRWWSLRRSSTREVLAKLF